MPRAVPAALCVVVGVTLALPAAAPALAAPGPAAPALAAPTAATYHATGARPDLSANWSGYARLGTAVTSIAGSWRVPTVPSAGRAAYSASWVGIDGVGNRQLIQVGTGQDTTSGRSHYYAWWEVLPGPETRIASIAVSPGDLMIAGIARVSDAAWTITLRDATTTRSWSSRERYDGAGDSGEWIEEAPIVDGDQTTLADFDTVSFRAARINGANAQLQASQPIEMVDDGAIVARPSAPGATADDFTVTYGRGQGPVTAPDAAGG
jgi:hypothetical protein